MGKVGSRPAFSDLVIESTRNQGTVTVISKPRTRRLGNLLEKKKKKERKKKKRSRFCFEKRRDRSPSPPRFVFSIRLPLFLRPRKIFVTFGKVIFRGMAAKTMDRPRRPPLRKRVLHLLPPVLVTFVSGDEAARRYYVKMALDECTGLIGARDWTRRVPPRFLSLSLSRRLSVSAPR